MSRSMVVQRCLVGGPQAYLDAIEAALAQAGSVRLATTPHSENDIRQFLEALAMELRRNYPWVLPPVLELRLDNWEQLLGEVQPIARIELRQLEVSQRLGFEFGDIAGKQEPGLLLRLESGAVVGFLAPAKLSDRGVALVVSGKHEVRQIMDQISRVLMLQPTQLTAIEQTGHQARSTQRRVLPDLEPQPSGVERWSAERLERHRVVIDKEGRFRTIDGGVLDTRMASASWRPNAEFALFIMDPHGNFYVSLRRVVSRIHHSTLSGGGPVAAAGEFRVREGRLLVLTDHSGHYPPTRFGDQILVGELQQRGVSTADVLFDFAAGE
ncbi:hypothetical protein [Mycolicibacterium neworleansense]|nr:hypothetical protein [Mycolicibacterium neworleansense]MCV7363264.1 hypothetical protein [Mycolicibacterium neworleansense]